MANDYFIINEYGVIENPHRMTYKAKTYMAYTKQAELPNGKWAYGYGIELYNEGMSSPVTTDCSILFDNEQGAFQFALRIIVEAVEQRNSNGKYNMLLMAMRSDLKDIKPTIQSQLSLF